MTKSIDEQSKAISYKDFDNMELYFRKSAFNFILVISIFLIITGTIVIQLFMRDIFNDNCYFGIFKYESMTQNEIIGSGQEYHGPYFNTHIVSSKVQNNTVIITMVADTSADNIFAQQFESYVLMKNDSLYSDFNNCFYNPEVQVSMSENNTSQICLKYKIFGSIEENTSYSLIKEDENKRERVIFIL